jgi:gamma-glutamylcyclotransferase (GGCT)/AIG2-like uncharacterized protein YtfP
MIPPCVDLFVYGTLRRQSDHSLARTLAAEASYLGSAEMMGRLYLVDGYPGMVPSEHDDEWVQGEVFRLHDAERSFTWLDKYEGCGPSHAPPYEFERVRAEARLEVGETVACWVYLYRGQVSEDRRILSGDYFGSDRGHAP